MLHLDLLDISISSADQERNRDMGSVEDANDIHHRGQFHENATIVFGGGKYTY